MARKEFLRTDESLVFTFFIFNHCREVLEMFGSPPPPAGLATDQLAADAITSILKDKTVLSRSNMEQRSKIYGNAAVACQNYPFMLKSFGFVKNLI